MDAWYHHAEVECGFVIWDDQKTQETHYEKQLKSHYHLLGLPHPMTAQGHILAWKLRRERARKQQCDLLTGDDGATSNSGSVGEVEDITESFKRKRTRCKCKGHRFDEKGKKSRMT